MKRTKVAQGRASSIEVCIHVLGRTFRTRKDLATGFLRRVETGILSGAPELVPLLHSNGLELLYVTARTPMTMHDVRDHSLDGEHPRGPVTEQLPTVPRIPRTPVEPDFTEGLATA